MKDTALFVGWGETHPGRERKAQEHFKTWAAILEELKAKGDIDDFQHVLLSPHGGDLAGFTLVYGDPEKLGLLQMREDLHRLEVRSALDHGSFGVVWAAVGEGVVHEMELFEEAVTELEHEPVTV